MRRVPKTVVFLGLASLFTDFSSEMIYPLLPIFLTDVLGAGVIALGIIEGIAESTASLVKVSSGIWADRFGRRKPLIVLGYGLAGSARTLIALATVWPFVLAMRFLDRVGKGIRTSPRDALIADVTIPGQRGSAYGIHRSMDHVGAVAGPLAAGGLLAASPFSLRHIFLLSAIPAALVMVILMLAIKESPLSYEKVVERKSRIFPLSLLGGDFRRFLFASFVFSLGNSTDAFILLWLSEAGVPPPWVAVLWSLHHGVKVISTYLGGCLCDKVGSRKMMAVGWILYALAYVGFSIVGTRSLLILVFLGYGVYYGFTEPPERALVADLVPAGFRGTAFGYYHGLVGLGVFPASLTFGIIWHTWGKSIAFLWGAGLAVLAVFLVIVVGRSSVGSHEKRGPAKFTSHET